MENITSKNIKYLLKIFVTIYLIVIAISFLVALINSAFHSGEVLYSVIFAIVAATGIVTASAVVLPFIIYFAKANKRLKYVMRTAELRRGILLGFKRSFWRGTFYAYMEVDGKIRHSDAIYHQGYYKVNETFSLINKEVSYLFDGEKIYLISE